jgi:hypothetical protein
MTPQNFERILDRAEAFDLGLSNDNPTDQEVTAAARHVIGGYDAVIKAAGPDPSRVVIAGLVNTAILDDIRRDNEEALPGRQVPDLAKLKEMQEFAARFKKRNRLASFERVAAAVLARFDIELVEPEAAPSVFTTQIAEQHEIKGDS